MMLAGASGGATTFRRLLALAGLKMLAEVTQGCASLSLGYLIAPPIRASCFGGVVVVR